ncbi:hypothetical protein PMPD1_1373 [Paramixta manurensis]|uniref:Uncharacterized protein n=1 Tax=Paramixta manurensis TaxID=2740817 RepID=A0A6M8UHP1_9GAMM|nr:hypothetical protein PMPD1_1373 [Erwiniaceae bacterium PD-1]
MSNSIGGVLGMVTHLPQTALSLTPQGAAANLLKNIGDQMIHDIASKLTNSLFSGGMNQQGGGNGGASMGALGNGGNNMLENLMKQVLQQMGITPQNSPFNSGSGQNNMNAFNQGLGNGLSGTGGPTMNTPLSPQNANDFTQLGNSIGGQMGSKAGLEALNDVGTGANKGIEALLSGGHGGKVDGGSKETRAEIGKFMDQHPEVFGKPQMPQGAHMKGDESSSWEDALKNGKPLSDDSLKQFQTAKNDLKTSMIGGSIPTPPGAAPGGSALLNADAQLANSNIKQDAIKAMS